VVGLVVKQMTRQAGLGVLLGSLLAFAAAAAIASAVYGVSPLEPAVYLPALLLMGGSAFIAAWIPARRAIRVDPIETLRQE
jgi:ABC-type antimicrobial peptide transport system permease subunit